MRKELLAICLLATACLCGCNAMVAKPSHSLGVSTESNDNVSQEFANLMSRIETMRKIPNYMHEREFKGQFTETEAEILQKAKELIDQAEREGTMTPAQVLFARIYMILDDAPEEDQKRQAQLLQQLIETQPDYIQKLGKDVFFEHERYRAAIVCFKHQLKTSPDDLSIRLNLVYAYNKVGMYKDARVAVDDVLGDNLQLNEHWYVVAYQSKAIASLGLKDYLNCIQFAEKAYAVRPQVHDLMVIQLAAARTRDTKRLERAVQELQRTNPDEYQKMKLQLDAVEAYARVKNNQREVARKLVAAWKDDYRSEERVLRYWRDFPGGTDVAKNFSELTKR